MYFYQQISVHMSKAIKEFFRIFQITILLIILPGINLFFNKFSKK